MVETRTVVAVSAASAAAALAGYLIYFDYKRRNDPEFRKKLRKEKKKVAKSVKPDEAAGATPPGRSQDELKTLLAQINAEPLPTLPGEREQYFMEQVGAGEQLLARGPAFEVPAALSFYRALRAYPSPVEIIMIFQNTLPAHIFAIVMELASLDVSSSESELARESAPASVSDAVPAAVTVDPIPEIAPVTELETEPESEPSIHESEVVVDVEIESEVEVEVETEAGAETEPEVEAKVTVETDTKEIVEPEPETETVEVEVNAEVNADPDPQAEAEAAEAVAETVEALVETVEALAEAAEAAEAAESPVEVAQAPTEPTTEAVAEVAIDASIELVDPASVPLGSDSESESEGDAHSGVEVHSETESHHEIASQDGQPSESEWDQLSNPGASQAELPPQQHESN